MSQKQRKRLSRIIISAIFLVAALISEKLNLNELLSSVFYLTAYFIIGYDVIMKAAWSIRHRRFLDENFLMAIASVGAVCLSEFFEGVAVMLFYHVGELFQSVAVSKSRKSIASLMDIRPETANVKRNGKVYIVSPEEVEVGEEIEINPGEKIPLDGVIISGSSTVDARALTGESVPTETNEGDTVISGCINLSAVITVRVTKPYNESTVAKILELTEKAKNAKAKKERLITSFSRWYTPAVVIGALALALVPQLFIAQARMEWVRRALIFLVISCPCALVVSVPLTFFCGMGKAASQGIMVKGSAYLDALAKCGTVVFDKTGTLTKGSFEITDVKTVNFDRRVLIAVAAAAESHSKHPIAKALVAASGEDYKRFKVSNVKEFPGKGVLSTVEKWDVAVGNAAFMQSQGVEVEDDDQNTVVHIVIDGNYSGSITVSDSIKEEAYGIDEKLYELDIDNIVMLSGDKQAKAMTVAKELKIEKFYAALLPDDKVRILEGIKEKSDGTVAFVGDGINDAPVLALSDVGIAMGVLGSDAAIEAADVVITDDNPEKICTAVKIAKKVRDIAKQNIALSLSAKILFLILGVFGATGMAGAVFADVGILIIAVLNAMRAMK